MGGGAWHGAWQGCGKKSVRTDFFTIEVDSSCDEY